MLALHSVQIWTPGQAQVQSPCQPRGLESPATPLNQAGTVLAEDSHNLGVHEDRQGLHEGC